MAKFPGNTISLSDTVDQWSRKVHINVRNGKPTLVYRWRNRTDSRKHTQRITLSDEQAGRLLASLSVASATAIGHDKIRADKLTGSISSESFKLLTAIQESLVAK